MRIISTISFLTLIFAQTINISAQSVITFDDQGWNSDQILPSNFTIGNYSFSSNESFYTNYGYNFDVNGISLYYVFQNANLDKITIISSNNGSVSLQSLDAYQVSETSTDKLVIEGWNDNVLKYTKSFTRDSAWETLNLNYDNINKIVIRLDSVGSGGITDYNFDNFEFKNSVSSVSNDSLIIPKNYSLKQNYPNPFNPNTVIRYSIAKESMVTLKVYDLLGREVSTLVDENKAAGNYDVIFNAANLASGIYIYVLKAGKFISQNKMILLK